MPTRMSNNLIEYVLPIEWAEEYFDSDGDIDDVSYRSDLLTDWLVANNELIYDHCDYESFRTEHHDISDMTGIDLVCMRCYFYERNPGNSSDAKYRSKRRVNIGNTKAPLPKDIPPQINNQSSRS